MVFFCLDKYNGNSLSEALSVVQCIITVLYNPLVSHVYCFYCLFLCVGVM